MKNLRHSSLHIGVKYIHTRYHRFLSINPCSKNVLEKSKIPIASMTIKDFVHEILFELY